MWLMATVLDGILLEVWKSPSKWHFKTPAKMMKWGPPKTLSSIKATRVLAKMLESTFSELWKLTRSLQQSGSIYSKKIAESWWEQWALCHFLLSYSISASSAPQQPQNPTACNHNENQQPNSYWREQNRVEALLKPHSLSNVITDLSDTSLGDPPTPWEIVFILSHSEFI